MKKFIILFTIIVSLLLCATVLSNEEIISNSVSGFKEVEEVPPIIITVTSNHRNDIVKVGTPIILTAYVENAEGLNYEIVWQYIDENGMIHDAGTGKHYEFKATKENVGYLWRAKLTVIGD